MYLKEKIVLLMVLILLFSAGIPLAVGADEENVPRHIDPSRIQEESPTPDSYFSVYSETLKNIAAEDWNSALGNFGLVDKAYSGEDLQPVLMDLNNSGRELVRWSRRSATSIENARSLIERLEIEEARKEIENARYALAKLEMVAEDTSTSIEELSDRFGIDLPDTVREDLGSVRELMENYSQSVENQSEMVENDGYIGGENLTETELTLDLNSTQAEPGSEVRFNGRLKTSGGEPIQGKPIKIYVSENDVIEIKTGEDGRYSSSFEVPGVYRENISVRSVYFPRRSDPENHAPSSSGSITLDLLYETPSFELQIPSKTYPGRKLEVGGNLVLYGEGLSNMTVEADWMGRSFTVKTGTDGGFSLDIPVSPNVTLDSHTLEVSSLPRADVGPAKIETEIPTVKVDSEISHTAPGFSVLGREVTIEGVVEGEESDLEGSTVVLDIGEETVSSEVLENGRFRISYQRSLSDFSGEESYTLRVYPEDPWIKPSSTDGEILFLNPLTMTFVLVGGLSFVLFWLVTGRGESKPMESVEIDRREEIEDVDERVVGGIKGLFVRGVKAVSKATGLSLKVNHTIREYLSKVRGKLGVAYEPFESLCLKFEEHLYSDHEVEEDRTLLEKTLNLLGRAER